MKTRSVMLSLALAAAAFIATAIILMPTSPADAQWVMSYAKPTGPYRNEHFDGIEDPAPGTDVNQYLAELAGRCRLTKWTVAYNYVTDVNDTAKLEIAEPSGADLACLKRFERPPYIVMERTKT